MYSYLAWWSEPLTGTGDTWIPVLLQRICRASSITQLHHRDTRVPAIEAWNSFFHLVIWRLDAHYQLSEGYPRQQQVLWGILQQILQGHLKAVGMRHTEGTLKKGELKDMVIGRGHEGGEAGRAHISQSCATQISCPTPLHTGCFPVTAWQPQHSRRQLLREPAQFPSILFP